MMIEYTVMKYSQIWYIYFTGVWSILSAMSFNTNEYN